MPSSLWWQSVFTLILLIIILSYIFYRFPNMRSAYFKFVRNEKRRRRRTAFFHLKCNWNWNWKNRENAMQWILRYRSRRHRRCCWFLWDNFIICYSAFVLFLNKRRDLLCHAVVAGVVIRSFYYCLDRWRILFCFGFSVHCVHDTWMTDDDDDVDVVVVVINHIYYTSGN